MAAAERVFEFLAESEEAADTLVPVEVESLERRWISRMFTSATARIRSLSTISRSMLNPASGLLLSAQRGLEKPRWSNYSCVSMM